MGKSSRWTIAIIIELSAAGVLFLVSAVLLYLGIQEYRLQDAAVSAFEAYDANEQAKVGDHCRAALEIDERYHPARQLLAKVLLEQEKPDLDAAEKEYRTLIDRGYPEPNAHVGIGMIALIRASREEDPAAVANWIKSARHAFQDAGEGCPEAEIGLAHAALLENLENGGSLAPVKVRFQKILSRLESDLSARSSITRDGLVDLYAGLGRASCDPGSYQEEAATWFHISHYYAPDWALPLVNLIYIDAQRYATGTFTPEQLKAEKSRMISLTQLVEPLLNKSPAVKEAHLQRQLAIAYAFSRAGGISEFQNQIRKLRTGLYQDRIEPFRMEAFGLLEMIQRGGLEPTTLNNYLNKAVDPDVGAFVRLARHKALLDDAERVVLLNNSAVLLLRWGLLQNAPNLVRSSEKKLQEALKLDPDNPLLKGNLAAVQARIRK